MDKYFLLILAVLIATAGQILFKLGVNQAGPLLPEINSLRDVIQSAFIFLKNPYIISVFLIYGPGLICYLLLLGKSELTYIFPLLSITYIFILLFSWLILKENINALRIIGTLIIALGIFLVAKS